MNKLERIEALNVSEKKILTQLMVESEKISTSTKEKKEQQILQRLQNKC
jgi:hypothetical protein